jgi:secondary thiamine-phosphate synthase enzyme
LAFYMVITDTLDLKTKGQGDIVDVTSSVGAALERAGLHDGVVTLFVTGSTASITTIEFESGAVADFNRIMEEIVPRAGEYRHHLRWGDDNGSSHVRAALLGPSLTVPFSKGTLLLGTWQQIVVVECDTRARTRQLVLQFLGE